MNKFSQLLDRTFSKPRTYIGASSMGALAGVDKYKTNVMLYDDLLRAKRGEMPDFQGNAACTAGHDLEALVLSKFIAERYDDETAKAFMGSRIKEEPEHGIFHSWTECRDSHADLLVCADKPYIVEAKVTTFLNNRTADSPYQGYNTNDLTATGLPLKVYFQVIRQMACYGVETAFVQVMHGYNHLTYGPIEFNQVIADHLQVMIDRMYEMVENETPPEAESLDDLKYLYPVMVPGKVLEADLEMIAQATEYKTLQAKIKDLEKKKDDCKLWICKQMKDYSSCTNEGEPVLKMCGRGKRYPKIDKGI